MAKIGLLGGSFNPVHEGHLCLARAALRAGCVDRVLFLPAGTPAHKREALADAADRLAMVRLAVGGEEGMGVCLEEIDRPGVSYTADTLHALHGRMPTDEWTMLIGADALMRLPMWRRADEVLRLCGFLVATRPGENAERALALAEGLRARGARIAFLRERMPDVSSTEIRRRLEAGAPVSGLVPSEVEAYMRTHRLYQREQGEDDIDETRKDGL